MNTINLNLARKWRSKNFDQIVGQDLSVKMLKNSLYLGSYFPVYLFSGQRGCGKTSLARVFASAVNCTVLPDFQKKPTSFMVPCLTCQSCSAMSTGSHPDFVEIDAASHTGVDMIRQIIDASNLLPVMGVKKVYLIDEAHMLSKASFNALLKILEEPPQSVLFILATTDAQKILDTVRSRCFQLFFKSIDAPLLITHLQDICTRESIAYEKDGLRLIVDETQGSARDAINMLEQVRFSSSLVSKEAVLHVLGHSSDETIIALLDCVLNKKSITLLQFLQEHSLEFCSTEFMYRRFFDAVRAAVWIKHGVSPDIFKSQLSAIKTITSTCSLAHLNKILDVLCAHELVFNKTTVKYQLFEMILLQLCQKNNDISDANGTPSPVCPPHESNESYVDEDGVISDDAEQEEDNEGEQRDEMRWRSFTAQVSTLHDPLVLSVFTQGYFVSFDRVTLHLQVAFAKDLLFFKDWLDKTIGKWQPLLNAAFQAEVIFIPLFTLDIKERAGVSMQKETESTQPVKKVPGRNVKQGASLVKKEPTFDVSDVEIWQKTTMIMRYFPGIISEIKEQGVHYE